MTANWKKNWTERLYIGLKSTAIPGAEPDEGWRLTEAWAGPAGAPFPADPQFDDLPMQQDISFARLYLNGFVWHNDIDKTQLYREASQLIQMHCRRCAEIRVWAGLRLILRPMRDYFAWAREQGEDF